MVVPLLGSFHCSTSLFDLANFTRTRGVARKVIKYGCESQTDFNPPTPNQAGPTQLDTWFGSLNCCVENLLQVTGISFWRKGSRRLNATERAGLWITKPNNSANNGTAIVWEQRRWELTYWCILEDWIIAWQTSSYYRNFQYWSTVLAQDGWTTEYHNSTQRNMNLFFDQSRSKSFKVVQSCSKLKTQDSPLVLYLPQTWINGTAIVWEQRRWALTYWCILEDWIIAWQTSSYYRNCQYWSTVLAQDGLTTEKNTSTQLNTNLFFVQSRSKMKTKDSPLVLYLSPTTMNIGKDFGRNEVKNEKDSIYGWWSRDCINSVRSSSQKNYVQIQVGTTVQCTRTNTWSRNRRENCTG